MVVGAGPAGTAAATTLARAGLEVVVVDKATFPRDKICGDGLTTSALRELDALGLDPRSVESWIDVDDVVVRSPSGHQVTFPLPRDAGRYGAVARRRDLDAALVDLARTAGATVVEGRALRAATEHAGGVDAEFDGLGTVRARWAIGADGMWSPLRKALGLADSTYRGEWHAFRQYLTHVSPAASRELVVWFEPDLLPGYAWSFPIAGGCGQRRVRDPPRHRLQGRRHGGRLAGVAGPPPHPGASSAPRPWPRRRTGPGPSPPGSTGSCCRRGGRSSWVMRRRRATR